MITALIFEKFCPQCCQIKRIRSFYAHIDECRSCYRTLHRTEKLCRPCGRVLDIAENFHKVKGGKIASWCKKCSSEYSNRKYHEPENRAKSLAARRVWAHKNRDRVLARDRAGRLRRKTLVFEHYGNGIVACACCPETEMKFLTLDHVGAEGADHRRILKETEGGNGSGWFIYKWLLDNGMPAGYQILCFSCNVGKHRSGVNKCPHQIEREALWQSFIDHVTPQTRPNLTRRRQRMPRISL